MCMRSTKRIGIQISIVHGLQLNRDEKHNLLTFLGLAPNVRTATVRLRRSKKEKQLLEQIRRKREKQELEKMREKNGADGVLGYWRKD